MKLDSYYFRAVIFPSGLIIILSIGFAIIDNFNYKSEWLTGGGMIIMAMVTSFIFCLLICLLSLTIFLNTYEIVRRSFFLSFLSWFLLPMGLIAIVLMHEMTYNKDLIIENDTSYIYPLILTIPYIISITLSFIKYKLSK
jgi:hypothetical protein